MNLLKKIFKLFKKSNKPTKNIEGVTLYQDWAHTDKKLKRTQTQRHKEYYWKNRERIRKVQALYYERNKTEINRKRKIRKEKMKREASN